MICASIPWEPVSREGLNPSSKMYAFSLGAVLKFLVGIVIFLIGKDCVESDLLRQRLNSLSDYERH